MDKKYCVYMHTFPNGKKYIGCTTNPKTRWWGNGVGYKFNEDMYADILHFGWKNVKHEILHDNLTKEEAYRIESELILKHELYKKENGYNVSQGNVAGVFHRVLTEESRQKMRDAKKGTACHTQKHSAETKAKISESRKGKRVKENHPMATPVYCLELDRVFAYAKLAEEETGVSRSHICQVCKGQRKTAGKMHWKYVG